MVEASKTAPLIPAGREASTVASVESVGEAMARTWSRGGRGQRRPGLVAGAFGVAVALALALSACTSAQRSGSAAAGGSQPAAPPGMSCAWPTELNVQSDNSAVPNSVSVDSAEAVWFQPIVAAAGTRIVLSGRFPDARYALFSVYTPSGAKPARPCPTTGSPRSPAA